MSLTVLHNYVIVKEVVVADPKTEGGILLPESSVIWTTKEGRALAVGPGRHAVDGSLIPNKIQPGDHVLYKNGDGRPMILDGQNFVLLTDDLIIAVIKPEET